LQHKLCTPASKTRPTTTCVSVVRRYAQGRIRRLRLTTSMSRITAVARRTGVARHVLPEAATAHFMAADLFGPGLVSVAGLAVVAMAAVVSLRSTALIHRGCVQPGQSATGPVSRSSTETG
jgi:hypothetical protein